MTSSKIKKLKYYLDFEVERGTNPVNLKDLNYLFQQLRRPDLRVYFILLTHSLRPGEPTQLTWNNFSNGMLIFRPEKQKKRGVLRKIRLSTGAWREIMDYKNNNFFPESGKIFPFKSGSYRRIFNHKFRKWLGGIWEKKADNLRQGLVPQYHHYTLQSFRCMASTLTYYYYSKVYGDGDLPLTLTCKFMGHSANKMTATYYIKRVDKIGLEYFPDVPMLNLIDLAFCKSLQPQLNDFIEKERQSLAIEY